MLFHNPTVDDREAILILSKRDDLTEYEENALQSLDERDIWTEKQAAWLDELFARKVGG